MNIREMRNRLNTTQSEFAKRYGIPFRTIQNWESGVREAPEYVIKLLEDRVNADLINRRTVELPKYDSRKKDLPQRRNFVGSLSWLKAVREELGESAVFALDEALMCQGSFGGHSDEYLVWVYGDDSLTRFNGVVLLGNKVSPYNVIEKNGLLYTDLNRTVTDSIANRSILDMQGITEALSKYYYSHGNSFEGISPAPEYQEEFGKLAQDAISYYDS